MNRLPIILDTDIGDDVDDALALALILNSPELDLRGVTTVFRDAPRRAKLTEYLLGLWQRADVPVRVGCSKPLLQPFDAKLGNQFEVLPASPKYSGGAEDASDFLIRAVQAAQEKLTLVPIGPLTNVAVALARWPELASRVRIVMMGGAWNRESQYYQAEWNVWCDPEAAAMVFNSGAAIDMIGLDVTRQCVLSQQDVKRIAEHDSSRGQVLARLIELWMSESKRSPTLHDPLAVLTLFSDCVRFTEKCIEMQLGGEERGTMRVLDSAPNVRVATEVDVSRAIDLFMARVLL